MKLDLHTYNVNMTIQYDMLIYTIKLGGKNVPGSKALDVLDRDAKFQGKSLWAWP